MGLVLGAAPVEAMVGMQSGNPWFSTDPPDGWVLLIALALQTASILLAGRAAWHLASGHARSLTITVSGPYATIRHPLTLSRLLHGAGGGLLLGMRTGWLAFGVGAVLLLMADAQEERAIADRHPTEYARWRCMTGRYWPCRPSPNQENAHD